MNQKLRGFDSVASVTSSTMAEYRLVCGKGIKNLHIWQFLPDHLDEGSEIKGKWTCIYDVPSNGHTLECLAFRNNGHEVLSKSSNANIRLWNISSFETDPSLKPSYQDIPDSAYTKSFHGDYAFGGLYDMVSINHKDFTQSKATKSALVEDDSECTEDKDPLASVLSFRSVYILPEAVVEWETGMKKKR
jgi:WD40 repeat protein